MTDQLGAFPTELWNDPEFAFAAGCVIAAALVWDHPLSSPAAETALRKAIQLFYQELGKAQERLHD